MRNGFAVLGQQARIQYFWRNVLSLSHTRTLQSAARAWVAIIAVLVSSHIVGEFLKPHETAFSLQARSDHQRSAGDGVGVQYGYYENPYLSSPRSQSGATLRQISPRTRCFLPMPPLRRKTHVRREGHRNHSNAEGCHCTAGGHVRNKQGLA